MKQGKKLNCWEYMKCGRESGGSRVHEFGVCPATTSQDNNGEVKGNNNDRCCWKITGTFCEGKIQNTFAGKLSNCAKCPFFTYIVQREGISFFLTNSRLL